MASLGLDTKGVRVPTGTIVRALGSALASAAAAADSDAVEALLADADEELGRTAGVGAVTAFAAPAFGGATPLHCAAAVGCARACELLLDASLAEKTARVPASGMTPLAVATSTNALSCVQAILAYGSQELGVADR